MECEQPNSQHNALDCPSQLNGGLEVNRLDNLVSLLSSARHTESTYDPEARIPEQSYAHQNKPFYAKWHARYAGATTEPWTVGVTFHSEPHFKKT